MRDVLDRIIREVLEAKENGYSDYTLRVDLLRILEDYEKEVCFMSGYDSVSAMEDQIDDLEGQVDYLDAELEDARDEISDLEDKLYEANKQITELGGEPVE